MNEHEWDETQQELRKLKNLLPQLSADMVTSPSTILTIGLDSEALARGRIRWLSVMIRRGWRLSDDRRRLVRGEGREHQERPAYSGFVGATPPPWDVRNYNPRLHCPAALMGAQYVGPNRFRMGSVLVDSNGSARIEAEECPVCGCMPHDTWRQVRIENPNPYAEPWKQRFAPCPRCGDYQPPA